MPKTDNVKPAAIVPAAPTVTVPADADQKTAMEVEADAEREQLDSALATMLDDASINAKLAALNKAGEDDFTEKVTDFWKPGAAGTPDAELRGIYVGSAKQGRLLQYGILKLNKDGTKQPMKLNGTHSLTSAFRTIKPGTPVRIKFLGATQTQGMVNGVSRKLNQFDVQTIK